MEVWQSQSVLRKGAGEYIVCLQRKNNPRVSVRICEQSCRFKDRCKEYESFSGMLAKGRGAVFSGEARIA